MAQITYADKSAINVNPDVASTNKVEAGDMNEIKSVVNANDTAFTNATTYSTTEVDTGKKWIDGKPIYRKVFNYGQLPNNTSVGVKHNIPIDTPVSAKGTVKTRSGAYNAWTIPSPNIFVDLSYNEVFISTNTDRSNLDGLVIIEYTKTTD